jgi:hypothetical protein
MLRVLKSNNPGLVVGNIVLIILYRIFFLSSSHDVSFLLHHTEPLSKFLFGFLHQVNLDGAFPLSILGGALCFVQSLLVNLIVNTHKVTSRKNYLGGLLFVIWSSFFNEFLVLSPAQIALTFLLFLFHKIFTLSKQEKLYGDIFDLGFLTSISILFYFPSAIFILIIFIGVYTVRTFSVREFSMILLGFGAVAFSVFTIYFWNDSLPSLFMDMINIQNRIPFHWGILHTAQVGVLVWMLLITIWVFLNLPSLLSYTAIQIRKYAGVLMISYVLLLIATVLHFNFNLSHLILLTAPLSLLSCLYFVETKTEGIAGILFIVLILSGFTAQAVVHFVT